MRTEGLSQCPDVVLCVGEVPVLIFLRFFLPFSILSLLLLKSAVFLAHKWHLFCLS